MVCPVQGCLAFPVCTAQAPGCSIWSRPCVDCGSSFRVLHKSTGSVVPEFCAFPGLSGSGSQRLGALSPGAAHFFPLRPQRAAGLVSGSLQTGPRACLPGGRGWLLWGCVCPFPLPLPPTSSGVGAALLWSFSVPLFCELPAVCSGQLIFSLALPQFKKSPSDCSQGLLAGPHPKECRRLLSVPPPLAGGGCGRLGYFSAGSCF